LFQPPKNQDVGAIFGWFFFAFCSGAVFLHFLRGDRLVLRVAGARELKDEEREVEQLVHRVAAAADLPPPEVRLINSWAPNALAVGLTPKRATVVLTTELVRRLESKELEAVVAHELAHVANRDGAVMTFVSGPSLLGDLMRRDGSGRGEAFFYIFYGPCTFSASCSCGRSRVIANTRPTVALRSSPGRPSS
jgi:hypothetical protein